MKTPRALRDANLIKALIRAATYTSALASASFLLSGCCYTTARIGGILGKDNPGITAIKEKDAGYEVWTCPNQPATIGWYVSSDVKTATIDNGIGQVQIPFGYLTVAPASDTTYTLTAKGDCEKTSQVFIKIIKPGTLATIDVPLQGRRGPSGYWETYLDPQFYDSHIKMTSISISYDVVGGSAKGWTLAKQDTNGALNQFLPIHSTPTTPAGFPHQLAGTHRITPGDPSTVPDWSSVPAVLTETLTLDCSQ